MTSLKEMEYNSSSPSVTNQQHDHPSYEAGNQSQQPSFSSQQPGYPPQQPGYPPQQPGYPPQQTGYPPQQPGYPPQQHGYPPQQPGYPPQQPGNQNISPIPPPAYSPQQPGMIQATTAPTVFIQQPTNTVFIANRSYLNFTGAIILSCFVYWCCGGIFGIIAFILAMVGQSSAASGDSQSAKSLLMASYITSAIGMVLAIIIIITIIIVASTAPQTYSYSSDSHY